MSDNSQFIADFRLRLECMNKIGAAQAGEKVDYNCFGCPALQATVIGEDGIEHVEPAEQELDNQRFNLN